MTARRRRTGVLALALVVLVAGCFGAPSPVGDRGAASGADASPAGGRSTATPSATAAATSTGRAPATGVPSAAGTASAAGVAPTARATVVDVIDGDTVRVRFRNGTRDTVRLLGVDTPEVYAENTPDEYEGVPDTAAGKACLRRYGHAASDYAERRLAGATVSLAFDRLAGRRGYYDRLLAYVYVDGEQFNYALLREGYARLYDSEFLERSRYAVAERRARSGDRGLWTCADGAAGGATATSSAPGPLAVAVHADAAGDDRENLNDEYVRFRNVG
ncbi:MAG: thermonuclease family protein, partial [Salinigranum sp.]